MKEELFNDLVTSLEQAAAHARGEAVPGLRVHPAPTAADIIAIRQNAGLTRKEFAAILGTSVGTLRKWEDGARSPTGAARTLLLVLRRNPRAVLDALAA
jgi:putative transcriptional regulator